MNRDIEGALHRPRVMDRATIGRLQRHGELRRLTRYHQRSFHLAPEQAAELGGTKQDVDYSLKGLPDTAPHVQWLGQIRPTDFRIEGLVPRGETRRAKMKQDFFLSHGLPTEQFLEIYDLPEVPSNNRYLSEDPQYIPISEWKRRVAEQLEYRKTHTGREYFDHFADHLILWKTMSAEDIEHVSSFMNRTDFVVVLREQPVEATFVDTHEMADTDTHFSVSFIPGEGVTVYVDNQREQFSNVRKFKRKIPELARKAVDATYAPDVTVDEAMNAYWSTVPRLEAHAQAKDTLYFTNSTYFSERMLKKAFDYINSDPRHARSGLLPAGGLDIRDENHIKYYFEHFAPVSMAQYLADMHDLGISHGYAHGQNWKLGLFLVDLDSAKGRPFGDPEVTDSQRLDDIQRTVHAIDTLFVLRSIGVMSNSLSHSYLAAKFLESGHDGRELDKIFAMRKESVCQFLSHYLLRQKRRVTKADVRELLAGLDILEYEGKEYDYYSNPPITKWDYAHRIYEIVDVN